MVPEDRLDDRPPHRATAVKQLLSNSGVVSATAWQRVSARDYQLVASCAEVCVLGAGESGRGGPLCWVQHKQDLCSFGCRLQ